MLPATPTTGNTQATTPFINKPTAFTPVDPGCMTPTQIAVTAIVLALIVGGASYCCHHFEAGTIATIAVPTAGGVAIVTFIAVSACSSSSSPATSTTTDSQPPAKVITPTKTAAPAQSPANTGAPTNTAPPPKSAADLAAEQAAATAKAASDAAAADAAAQAAAQAAENARQAAVAATARAALEAAAAATKAAADAAAAEATQKAAADAATARATEEAAAAAIKAAADAAAQADARARAAQDAAAAQAAAAAAARATEEAAAAAAKAASDAATQKAAADVAAAAERARAQSALPNPGAHTQLPPPAPPATAAAPAQPATVKTDAKTLTNADLQKAFKESGNLAALQAKLAPSTLEMLDLRQLGALLAEMVRTDGKENMKDEIIRLAAIKATPSQMLVAIQTVIANKNKKEAEAIAVKMLNAHAQLNGHTLNEILRDGTGGSWTILDAVLGAKFENLANALTEKGAKRLADIEASKWITQYNKAGTQTVEEFAEALALKQTDLNRLAIAFFIKKLAAINPAQQNEQLNKGLIGFFNLKPTETTHVIRLAIQGKNEALALTIATSAPQDFVRSINNASLVINKEGDKASLLTIASNAGMTQLSAKLEELTKAAPATATSPTKADVATAAAAIASPTATAPAPAKTAETPTATAAPAASADATTTTSSK